VTLTQLAIRIACSPLGAHYVEDDPRDMARNIADLAQALSDELQRRARAEQPALAAEPDLGVDASFEARRASRVMCVLEVMIREYVERADAAAARRHLDRDAGLFAIASEAAEAELRGTRRAYLVWGDDPLDRMVRSSAVTGEDPVHRACAAARRAAADDLRQRLGGRGITEGSTP
jgi:hypothetical protein